MQATCWNFLCRVLKILCLQNLFHFYCFGLVSFLCFLINSQITNYSILKDCRCFEKTHAFFSMAFVGFYVVGVFMVVFIILAIIMALCRMGIIQGPCTPVWNRKKSSSSSSSSSKKKKNGPIVYSSCPQGGYPQQGYPQQREVIDFVI